MGPTCDGLFFFFDRTIMTRSLFFFALSLTTVLAHAQTWNQKADLAPGNRWGAEGFSIGTKGYITVGANGGNLNDLWAWDQATNTWEQKADFPGTARREAASFSLG